MRILLADPPAFTPQYDHELASALAHAGNDVELVTSRFRFGEAPEPDGTSGASSSIPSARDSSGARGCASRSSSSSTDRARTAGAARGGRGPHPVAAAPRSTSGSFACERRRSSRRTTAATTHGQARGLWRRLMSRFERIVVHSERGRDTLTELGVEPDRLRVIPMPVFGAILRGATTAACFASGSSGPRRASATRSSRRNASTASAVGRRQSARAGRRLREHAGDRAESRLGTSPRARSTARSATPPSPSFYRPEIDQSGALLRALGAGVPVIGYNIGGIGEPVRRFGAGRVVPAGDLDGLTEAVRELLDNPDALERGSRRGRTRPAGARPGKRRPGAPRALPGAA